MEKNPLVYDLDPIAENHRELYVDDPGPFDDLDKAFGAILDKDTIDVCLIDYVVTSALPPEQCLALCAKHVTEGRTITINGKRYLLKSGSLLHFET